MGIVVGCATYVPQAVVDCILDQSERFGCIMAEVSRTCRTNFSGGLELYGQLWKLAIAAQ